MKLLKSTARIVTALSVMVSLIGQVSTGTVTAAEGKNYYYEVKSLILNSNYNDFYDVNGDGVINVFDALRIQKENLKEENDMSITIKPGSIGVNDEGTIKDVDLITGNSKEYIEQSVDKWMDENIDDIKNDLKSDVNEVKREMAVQEARMDQLVGTVPEGSADEIADARVTADGKTEANLGNAIRSQVSGLKETITNSVNQLNDVDKDITNNGILTYTNILKQNNILRDINHYYSPSEGYRYSEGRACYLIEVEVGKTYYTTCSSYVIYDADMNKISNANIGLNTIGDITIPVNGKYVAINFNSAPTFIQEGTDGYWFSLKNGTQTVTSEYIKPNEVVKLISEQLVPVIDNVESVRTELYATEVDGINLFNSRTALSNTTLNGNGTENHTENAIGYSTSDFIDIEGYTKMSIWDTTSGTAQPLNCYYCLYDADKNCIQDRTRGGFEFAVSAKYIRFYYHSELSDVIMLSADQHRPVEYEEYKIPKGTIAENKIDSLVTSVNAFDINKAHVGYYITPNHEVGKSDGKGFIVLDCPNAQLVRFFYTSGFDSNMLFAIKKDGSRQLITSESDGVTINTNSADRINYDGNRFGWVIVKLPENTVRIELNFASSSPALEYQTVCFDRAFPAEYTPYNSNTTLAYSVEVKEHLPYASLALFEKWAAIGDSYSVGAIHTSDGEIHNNKSLSCWSILGRLTGTSPSIYAKGGLTTRTWLTDPNGLAAMLADEPKNLYIIKLGINDYAEGKDAYLGTSTDINTSNLLASADSFYGNMAKIIGNIKQHSPSALIIIDSMAVSHTATQANYNNAMKEISEILGVAYMAEHEEEFFRSDYYLNGIQGYHPTAVVLSGMARTFDKMISDCIEKYYQYFKDFYVEI